MEEPMTKNIKFDSSDLLDKLCVIQIKQIIKDSKYKEFEKGISSIIKELNINSFKKKNIYFDAKIINLIIALSQINTFIWLKRDNIKKSNKDLNKNMKLSHQLNALRNLAKNKLADTLRNKKSANIKTNINKEDLKGWRYTIVEK
ncbi:hypothetical protein N8743_02015 [Candidatus Pelagibacter ubique]|jgi:hypothetical protein|nr:hypothetical protein [Candidatus Pelagibacter ubique]